MSAENHHVRVLTVCTGNIHRSPAAQYLLAEGFGPHSGILVASAGTRAVVGAPVSDQMAALLRADGIDPAGFAARRLTEVSEPALPDYPYGELGIDQRSRTLP